MMIVSVARSMAAGSCLLSASLLLRRRCPLCYPPHRAIQSTRSRRTVPWHLKSSIIIMAQRDHTNVMNESLPGTTYVCLRVRQSMLLLLLVYLLIHTTRHWLPQRCNRSIGSYRGRHRRIPRPTLSWLSRCRHRLGRCCRRIRCLLGLSRLHATTAAAARRFCATASSLGTTVKLLPHVFDCQVYCARARGANMTRTAQ